MLNEILKESNGQLSSTRVNSAFALLVSALITAYLMAYPDKITDNTLFILGGWLTAAFLPKTISKFAEIREKKVSSKKAQ